MNGTLCTQQEGSVKGSQSVKLKMADRLTNKMKMPYMSGLSRLGMPAGGCSSVLQNLLFDRNFDKKLRKSTQIHVCSRDWFAAYPTLQSLLLFQLRRQRVT